MLRRFILSWLLLPLFFGQASASPDYFEISPAQTRGSRVEVLEFFYYGCEQCAAFEPFLSGWLETHPELLVTRIPAVSSAKLPLAKAYYCLLEMGSEERLRAQLYSHGGEIVDEASLFEFLQNSAVDLQRFKSLYYSAIIDRKILDATVSAREFGITATPALIIDRRYFVLGNLARSELLDELVQMAAKQRAQQ